MRIRKIFITILVCLFLLTGCQKREKNVKPKEKSVDSNTYKENETDKEKKQSNTDDKSTDDGNKTNEIIMLDVQQSIQETSYYCGPANIQMILNYHGIHKTQDELASQLHTHKITGTEYIDMTNVLNSYLFGKNPISDSDSGYRVQTISRNDDLNLIKYNLERRIRTNINDGYPTILAVNMNRLYAHMPVANHVVLCVGYALKENANEIEYVYVIDPYDKVQDAVYGGLKKFTVSEIIEAIINNDEPAYIW